MTPAAPAPPPSAEDVETAILRYAFDDTKDHATLVDRIVDDQRALSFIFQIIDDVSALHTFAHSRLAIAEPPGLESLKRLDALLDDVMVMLAHRSDPGGGAGQKAGGGAERAVPVGEG